MNLILNCVDMGRESYLVMPGSDLVTLPENSPLCDVLEVR